MGWRGYCWTPTGTGRRRSWHRARWRSRRSTRQDGGAGLTIARGTFDAPAGPLRVRLELTSHGRRWTRRTPRLPVLVTVSTRAGGDHLADEFESRLR